MAIPSRIQFEISMFPSNVPTPTPATGAWMAGVALHLTNFLVIVSRARRTPADVESDWDTIVRENEHGSTGWFDWVNLFPLNGWHYLAQ